jgi:P-type E1-E2 ATPase
MVCRYHLKLSLLTVTQDWSSNRVVASISRMLPSQVVVLRDGSYRAVTASELVPGDIIEIRAGNKVPADLRLCQVSGELKFDRSVLTGESEPIPGSVNFTDDNFLEVYPPRDILKEDQEHRYARNVLYRRVGCRSLHSNRR